METEALIRRYGEAPAPHHLHTKETPRPPDWEEDGPPAGERGPRDEAYRKTPEDPPWGRPRPPPRGGRGGGGGWGGARARRNRGAPAGAGPGWGGG